MQIVSMSSRNLGAFAFWCCGRHLPPFVPDLWAKPNHYPSLHYFLQNAILSHESLFYVCVFFFFGMWRISLYRSLYFLRGMFGTIWLKVLSDHGTESVTTSFCSFQTSEFGEQLVTIFATFQNRQSGKYLPLQAVIGQVCVGERGGFLFLFTKLLCHLS